MINDAIRRRASFNIIHLATMMKVDVFVLSGDVRVLSFALRRDCSPSSSTSPLDAMPATPASPDANRK